MDLYSFSLLLGGAGLAAMGVSSLSHQAGGARGHGHGHGGRLASRGHARGPNSAKAGAAPQAAPAPSTIQHIASAAMALLSPRLLFSVMLGLGLTGMLVRHLLSGIVLLAVALIGGILFERLLIAPLWGFLLRFASNPAVTLESCITDDATAVTNFDKDGHGLVSVEVDGQVVQVLGTLKPDDRSAGIRIRAGDRVRIEEVDSARHRCIVSVP